MAHSLSLAEEFDQKRALYQLELRTIITTSMAVENREKFSADLIGRIANCLLDGTVFPILRELHDIQNMKERELYADRQRIIADQRQGREDILAKNQPLFFGSIQHKLPSLNLGGTTGDPELENYEKRCQAELRETEKRMVLDLDHLVENQQSTLGQAGVPEMTVTSNPEEIRFQMMILDLIDKLSAKFAN